MLSIEHFCPSNSRVSRSLTSLDLYGNEIGAGGAKAIAESLLQSALTRLVINVELDIEQLKTNVIDLNGKSLRAEEAIIVAKCIEFNRALTSLDLSVNEIGAGGAEAIAAALPQS